MNRKIAVAAAAALSLACAGARAANDPGLSAIVDPIARPLVAGGHCEGLAIGIDQAGAFGEVFYGNSGTKRPLDGKTEFEIDSVTKTFTALVLALATERAKSPMKLDDPLQKYAPAGVKLPAFDGQPIRLVDLATHTAGLPRKDDSDANQTEARVWAFTSKLNPASAPGTKFLYSNLGFGLLGMAEEDDQKQTIEQMFERQITGPLGMSDTRIALTAEQQARKAEGHHPNGKPAPDAIPSMKQGVLGAFALNSTVDDMLKYLALQMGGGTGDLMNAVLLTQKPVHPTGPAGQIALAWNVNRLKDGTVMISKDGTGAGFTAYIAFTPATHTGVVVLANQLSCAVPKVSAALLSALNHGDADDAAFAGDDDVENGE